MRIKPETREVLSSALRFLAAGGVLTLALLAPNAIGPITKLLHTKNIPPRRARAAIRYLNRHGLVIMKESGDTVTVEITEKGKRRLAHYDFENLRIKRPARWDGTWRLVSFDIPEKKKRTRESLRDKLRELGFLKIQQSLWVHPYACRDEVNFISEVFQISPYLWLLEATTIDHADFLRKKFNLAT